MEYIHDLVRQWSDKEKAAAIPFLLESAFEQNVFQTFAGAAITVPMEYCILSESRTHILLFRRPHSDPVFPGMWHVSGSVQKPKEESYEVWERVRSGSKYGLLGARFFEPVEIGTQDTQKGIGYGECPRGQERNIIHAVTYVAGTIGYGKWFPLNDLPVKEERPLLSHHERFIRSKLIPWVMTQQR